MRVEHLPEEIRAIGWKAQARLCQRYRRLSAACKPQPKVITAIVRELAGFVWNVSRTSRRSCTGIRNLGGMGSPRRDRYDEGNVLSLSDNLHINSIDRA